MPGDSSQNTTDQAVGGHSRDAVRRDILRANTAIATVLAVVLLLVLVVVLTAGRSEQNRHRAEQAETESQERLWNSYVAQARATRLTAEAGRKESALQVISNAAAIRTSPALRTEAIASLALADLLPDGGPLTVPKEAGQAEMDAALERFAYGDAKGNVFVCRLKDGAKLISLNAHELGPGTRLGVRSTAFSPDGKTLAVRFDGGALVIWRLDTQERIIASGVWATNVVIAGMSFTPDSARVAFSDADRERQISVYDLATAGLLHSALKAGARTFRFRPGSLQVALATDNKVDLFDYPAETVLQTFPHPTRVFTSAWSPDGSQLAVSCEDGDVYLWDVDRGTQRLLRGHSEPCVRLGFSPDGKVLFTGARDSSTRLWDAALGQLIVVAHDGVAHIFSPDGLRVGFWRMMTSFGVWRVENSSSYFALSCPKADGALLSVDLSPSGRWCLAVQSKGFRLWGFREGNAESFHPIADLACARLSPDEQSVFICSPRGLEAWSMTGGQTNGKVSFDPPRRISLPDSAGARSIALSMDGSAAAVELDDLRLIVLDLRTSNAPVVIKDRWRARNFKSPGSATGAGRFAISPSGDWVVTGYFFGNRDVPKVWNARTGELVTALDADSSLAAFSSDGKWLGLAGVNQFSLWSVGDWKRAKLIQRDEPSYTHGALAFSGDARDLAITRTRQRVQLRAALGEENYCDLVAPVPQSVNSLRLATNGSVLVTASARDVIQVWRLKDLRLGLAAMKLDWQTGVADSPARPAVRAPSWLHVNATLLLGLAGFGLATTLSLLTLRRHRLAIERFLAAEVKAAARHRELEVAKVELMHSQKMQALGTLATGIAHDFNNLLSVIRMSNKLIGREAQANPEIQEHVTDIEQAVLQGKSVVGSMLGYARGEGDANTPTDVNAVVENAVSLLSKEFLSGLTLTLALDRHAPPVAVGRGRIEQVLLNLLVNASEAMQGQGKLNIAVHTRSGLPELAYVLRPNAAARFVELRVSDSGPGITPEIRDRLFEPFFTTKRSGAKTGTGLGLSLVYSIAEQDGLGLSVDSEPGKGATFALVIPVEATASPVRQMHSSQNLSPAYAGGANDRK